jgi:putative transposase
VHDSFYIANDKVQVAGTRLRIPMLGWVRMREALRFTGKLMAAVVSRIADRWYVSLSVQVDPLPPSGENQAGRVGVDLGIRHLATLSTPREHIEGPKPLRAALKQLRRCNRQLTRRVKFLANWHKTKRKLARAISDMGLGMFRRLLTYKAAVSGTQIIVADRWFPSSKLCLACGSLHEMLTLADRVFVCPACGFTDDRDFHAADNLERTSRTHSHKPLNLLAILFIGHTGLKYN